MAAVGRVQAHSGAGPMTDLLLFTDTMRKRIG